MVRFIEQEAREKAEEILDQTELELETWKNEFKTTKRAEWKAHYESEKKRREVAGKIAESKLKYSEDERLMKERQDIMLSLKREAREKLSATIKSKKSEYTKLLEDLLVEGMLKLMEPRITVRCVKGDQSIVRGLLGKAKSRFTEEMQKTCTEYKSKFNMNTDIALDATPLSDSCIGGVWVMSAAYTSRPDAIIVRNSLDARLETCVENITPVIRALMFPEDEQRAKEIADSREKALAAMAAEHH